MADIIAGFTYPPKEDFSMDVLQNILKRAWLAARYALGACRKLRCAANKTEVFREPARSVPLGT
jgi:hypothetical protein